MGLCASGPPVDKVEGKVNKEIQTTLSESAKVDARVVKLLLLGAGESGKSTLFKQIVHLHANGYSDKERLLYLPVMQTQAILSMKTLLEQSELLAAQHNTAVDAKYYGSRNIVMALNPEKALTPDDAKHIETLWNDTGIKRTFELRAHFQLPDSCQYFFDHIQDIARMGYVPSFQDIVHVRARTTGIMERSFVMGNTRFNIVDVGGQRNERRKWMHCFDDVTGVIFVAAINEYDQVLYEDGKTNRLMEALHLFAEISHSKWFVNSAMILFLNKKDLFAEKIRRVDLKGVFPEYTGGKDYNNGVHFITERFLQAADGGPPVYVHVTCATDTDQVSFTFQAVKDIVIKKKLKQAGLLE